MEIIKEWMNRKLNKTSDAYNQRVKEAQEAIDVYQPVDVKFNNNAFKMDEEISEAFDEKIVQISKNYVNDNLNNLMINREKMDDILRNEQEEISDEKRVIVMNNLSTIKDIPLNTDVAIQTYEERYKRQVELDDNLKINVIEENVDDDFMRVKNELEIDESEKARIFSKVNISNRIVDFSYFELKYVLREGMTRELRISVGDNVQDRIEVIIAKSNEILEYLNNEKILHILYDFYNLIPENILSSTNISDNKEDVFDTNNNNSIMVKYGMENTMIAFAGNTLGFSVVGQEENIRVERDFAKKLENLKRYVDDNREYHIQLVNKLTKIMEENDRLIDGED